MRDGMTKRDLSILIGNALDHFDTALYGFLAPLLAPLFFPTYEPVVQLILAYSLLATSLVTRPIGSFIFGNLARHYGPVLGLSYSLMGVAIATVGIGCLPIYATIGWLAPLGLILLRMLSGVFAAGEVTIAQLYILEGKPHQGALKASYLYHSSTMVGIILASGAATIVIIFNHHSDILWRLCFWFGGITGFIGYFLRNSTMVHDKTKALFTSYRVSSLRSLWQHRSQILRIAIVTSFSQVTYVLPFIFMNSFVPLISTISLETMMALNTSLLVFDMVMIPVLGRITLNYNPTKVMITASLILASTIIPLFQGLHDASLTYVTFVRFWIVIWGIIFLCPQNLWCKRLFNSPEQYLLVGMGNAIGAATLGRMTPAICLWLWYTTQMPLAPAVYIALIMMATAVAVKTADHGEPLSS
jgi:MFS family permease